MHITCHWTDCLAELAQEDWESCFGTENVLSSYALQQALERSELAERFYYLRLYQDDCLVGIVCCFVSRYSLTDLATKGVQAVMNKLRNFYPNLLRPRLFVLGSPVATCTHLLGLTEPPSNSEYWSLIQSMKQAVEDKAAELRIRLVCIKEVDAALHGRLQFALGQNFIARRSPDTTYIYTAPVLGLEYEQNMLSRYRKAWKRRQREFQDAGLRWIIVDDFGPYVDTMHRLYLNVFERSQTRFERLSPAFFRAVNEELGEQSRALLCLAGDRIVGFELLLRGRELHPLYLGIDYEYRDSGALYFNCLYRVIEEAQLQGLPYLELGQTSYEAKFSVGAVASPRYFYIKHTQPICNRLLRLFQDEVFPQPQTPRARHVFKHRDEYLDALRSAGVLHADR